MEVLTPTLAHAGRRHFDATAPTTAVSKSHAETSEAVACLFANSQRLYPSLLLHSSSIMPSVAEVIGFRRASGALHVEVKANVNHACHGISNRARYHSRLGLCVCDEAVRLRGCPATLAFALASCSVLRRVNRCCGACHVRANLGKSSALSHGSRCCGSRSGMLKPAAAQGCQMSSQLHGFTVRHRPAQDARCGPGGALLDLVAQPRQQADQRLAVGPKRRLRVR